MKTRLRDPVEILYLAPMYRWEKLRDVEEMMAERGLVVTYETIRDWSQKFGGTYAKRLRSRTPRPGDRWHLDEVYLSINGKLQYLWHAVDQDGEVLDILVRFLATYEVIASFFRPDRHLRATRNCREVMCRRFTQWSEVINPGFAS